MHCVYFTSKFNISSSLAVCALHRLLTQCGLPNYPRHPDPGCTRPLDVPRPGGGPWMHSGPGYTQYRGAVSGCTRYLGTDPGPWRYSLPEGRPLDVLGYYRCIHVFSGRSRVVIQHRPLKKSELFHYLVLIYYWDLPPPKRFF